MGARRVVTWQEPATLKVLDVWHDSEAGQTWSHESDSRRKAIEWVSRQGLNVDNDLCL